MALARHSTKLDKPRPVIRRLTFTFPYIANGHGLLPGAAATFVIRNPASGCMGAEEMHVITYQWERKGSAYYWLAFIRHAVRQERSVKQRVSKRNCRKGLLSGVGIAPGSRKGTTE